MNKTSSAGFTIVETLMFLAISALLVLIVTTGRGEQARRTQFTDSVESLQSKLIRLQDERNSSTNPGTGKSNTTIDFMTRVLFQSNTSQASVESCTTSRDSGPLVSAPVCTEIERFDTHWASTYTNCTLPSGTPGPAVGVLFLRHHETGDLKTIPILLGESLSTTLTNYYGSPTARTLSAVIQRADSGQCAGIVMNESGRMNQFSRVFQ